MQLTACVNFVVCHVLFMNNTQHCFSCFTAQSDSESDILHLPSLVILCWTRYLGRVTAVHDANCREKAGGTNVFNSWKHEGCYAESWLKTCTIRLAIEILKRVFHSFSLGNFSQTPILPVGIYKAYSSRSKILKMLWDCLSNLLALRKWFTCKLMFVSQC